MTVRWLVGLAAASVLAAGCGGDDGTATTTDVAVDGAWARTSPMGTEFGAVYATIDVPADDRLVAGAVPDTVAGSAELHETMTAEGGDGMSMIPVDSFDAAPDEPLVLEPGGKHLMLIDLVEPLAEGATFPITLTFAEAGDVEVEVTVGDGPPST
jgi:periplasmic copper chaperone A